MKVGRIDGVRFRI